MARVAQLRAEHEKEQTVVDDAGTKLARAEQLAAAAVIPMAELDAARLAAKEASYTLKATAANIAAAQAVAAEAQVSLNYTTIRSPIDGIVIARHVDVGQAVKASVQTPILFTVADTRRMQLFAEIAESDVGAVRPGSKAAFQIEAIGNRSFEGPVSSVRLQPYLQQVVAPAEEGKRPYRKLGFRRQCRLGARRRSRRARPHPRRPERPGRPETQEPRERQVHPLVRRRSRPARFPHPPPGSNRSHPPPPPAVQKVPLRQHLRQRRVRHPPLRREVW